MKNKTINSHSGTAKVHPAKKEEMWYRYLNSFKMISTERFKNISRSELLCLTVPAKIFIQTNFEAETSPRQAECCGKMWEILEKWLESLEDMRTIDTIVEQIRYNVYLQLQTSTSKVLKPFPWERQEMINLFWPSKLINNWMLNHKRWLSLCC